MSSRIIKYREWDEKHEEMLDGLLECWCGEKVVLSESWANECTGCGTEYNGGGQQLAPREQWGEETGESLGDIEGPLAPDEL